MRTTAANFCITILLFLLLAGCGQEKTATESDVTAAADLSSDQAVQTGGFLMTPAAKADTAGADSQASVGETETDTDMETTNQMILTINGQRLTATLADNSSAEALKELLAQGPLTISMRDYANMEKVGDIGTSLPTNDEQITTAAGDLILYMGNAFVIYYAPNSWNLTRIGRINNVTAQDLKDILGTGSIDVTLSLK